MPFYTIDHVTHTEHTVRSGSTLAEKLSIVLASKNRVTVLIGGHRHSVFKSRQEAVVFKDILNLHGNQT